MRHRPSVRLRTRRLSSFRDDHPDLVGIRYEQTKQAEPPIPLPPPAHRCVSIRPRSSATPIVVVRPAIPPPPEDHPLFRLEPHLRPRPQTVSIVSDVESKRDSCAPTSSSITLQGDSDSDSDSEPEIETPGIADKLCIPSATSRALAPAPIPSPPRSSKRVSKRISLSASIVGKTFSIRATVGSKTMMETRKIRMRKKTLGSLGSLGSDIFGGEDDRDKVAFPEADGSSRESRASFSTLTPGSTPYARRSASASTADKAAMRGSLGSSKSPKGRGLRTPPRLQHGTSVGSSTGSSLAVTVGASRPGKGLEGPRGLLGPDRQPSQALIASTDSSSSRLGADNVNGPFSPINTLISQDRLAVDFGNLSFSNRGSIMFGGQAPVDNSTQRDDELAEAAQAVTPTGTAHAAAPTTPPPAVPLAPAADNLDHETEKETSREKETASSISSRLSDASGLTRPSITLNEDLASPSAPLPSIRVMPMDVERESQKVRSLYESGDGGRFNWQDGGRRVSFAGDLPPLPSEEDPSDVVYGFPFEPRHRPHHALATLLTRTSSRPSRDPPQLDVPSSSDWAASPIAPLPPTAPWVSSSSLRDDAASYHRPGARRWGEHERAGGLEDWENLDGVEVDRYGFIKERPARPETSFRPETSRTVRPGSRSRHSSPRRRNVLTKRPGSAYSSSPLGKGLVGRPPSRKVSARSLQTFTSEYSNVSRRSTRSSFRSITNHLPPNRDRRWMDEAGDMLAFPAGGLTDILEYAARMTGKKSTEALKKKELERSEKWRKMAKVIQRFPLEDGGEGEAGGEGQGQGQGMNFEFDTKNPKLIERTWKGIPDCWRSAAWFSFLATSAKNANSPETDEVLITAFKRLQDISSPDDVQIDLDVPRTVNGHIMFRKRYRGGQRLLFRILHAISLYFPDTGYVQGMAPLAATLLCYYDEERCFIMMVRLWRYRGLSRLYSPNFEGLLSTLDDFEKHWLAGKDVASKLVSF